MPTLQTGILLGAGGDGRLAGAARADYAQAAATVLMTPGHIRGVLRTGRRTSHIGYAELAAVVRETTSTPVVYKKISYRGAGLQYRG